MVILARKDDVPRINDVNLPRAFVDGVEGELRFILPLLPDVVYLFVEYQIGLKAVKTTMGSCVDWVGAMPQI